MKEHNQYESIDKIWCRVVVEEVDRKYPQLRIVAARKIAQQALVTLRERDENLVSIDPIKTESKSAQSVTSRKVNSVIDEGISWEELFEKYYQFAINIVKKYFSELAAADFAHDIASGALQSVYERGKEEPIRDQRSYVGAVVFNKARRYALHLKWKKEVPLIPGVEEPEFDEPNNPDLENYRTRQAATLSDVYREFTTFCEQEGPAWSRRKELVERNLLYQDKGDLLEELSFEMRENVLACLEAMRALSEIERERVRSLNDEFFAAMKKMELGKTEEQKNLDSISGNRSVLSHRYSVSRNTIEQDRLRSSKKVQELIHKHDGNHTILQTMWESPVFNRLQQEGKKSEAVVTDDQQRLEDRKKIIMTRKRLAEVSGPAELLRWVAQNTTSFCPSHQRLEAYKRLDPSAEVPPELLDVEYHVKERGCPLCNSLERRN